MLGATVWLVQQCKAGTRVPLLDKPDSGTPLFSYVDPLETCTYGASATVSSILSMSRRPTPPNKPTRTIASRAANGTRIV